MDFTAQTPVSKNNQSPNNYPKTRCGNAQQQMQYVVCVVLAFHLAAQNFSLNSIAHDNFLFKSRGRSPVGF
jgi:hypothetical protein